MTRITYQKDNPTWSLMIDYNPTPRRGIKNYLILWKERNEPSRQNQDFAWTRPAGSPNFQFFLVVFNASLKQALWLFSSGVMTLNGFWTNFVFLSDPDQKLSCDFNENECGYQESSTNFELKWSPLPASLSKDIVALDYRECWFTVQFGREQEPRLMWSWIKRREPRPRSHRMPSTLQQVHANYGTHCGQWECSHSLQASKVCTQICMQKGLRVLCERPQQWFFGICEAVVEASRLVHIRGTKCSCPVCTLGYAHWGPMLAQVGCLLEIGVFWANDPMQLRLFPWVETRNEISSSKSWCCRFRSPPWLKWNGLLALTRKKSAAGSCFLQQTTECIGTDLIPQFWDARLSLLLTPNMRELCSSHCILPSRQHNKQDILKRH